MLDKSRLAKKPDHSVLQPMEDREEKANSQAVYTELGDHSPTQQLSMRQRRALWFNFPKSSLLPGS